jgi:Family of unknown function (DUF6312)
MKIRSITVLVPGEDGQTSAHEIYREPEKKRHSKGFGLVGKVVRRAAEVNAAATLTYIARHKESNRKKKDGWIKDAPINVVRSGIRGLKRIRIASFF